MSSNLVTLVGERPPADPKPRDTTPPPKHIRVTSSTGLQVEIDLKARTFVQTKQVAVLEGIVSPCFGGSYWTLKPDPPQQGEDLAIWGPNTQGRARLLELHKVTIDPIVD